jgi:type II secretory pathway predicted ATPase ExeA
MACLLIGQPTLRQMVKLGVLAALDQRISTRYAMQPMTREETASYIHHHIKLAGRADVLYADDAIELIHNTSRGLPRAVNNLATQALIAAYTDRKPLVDHTSTRVAVNEVTTD